jgi:DNA ligase-1
MDIRNFFGGGGVKKAVVKQQVTETTKVSEVSEEKAKSLQVPDTSTDKIKETPQLLDIPISIKDIPKNIQSIITWKNGEKVPYSVVADIFNSISLTSSRLEKEALLTKLYRAVALSTPNDLDAVVYLTSNKIYPAYDGLELGIGDALLIKAVTEATGRNKAAVQAAYKNDGDLGIVASQSRSSQSMLSFGSKPKSLSATYVLEQLRMIAQTTGSKSMDRKVDIIKKMMVACQGEEAKYLIRALQGKLRIGTAAQTVLVGLAHAFVLNEYVGKSSADVIEDSSDEETEKEGESAAVIAKSVDNVSDDKMEVDDSLSTEVMSTEGVVIDSEASTKNLAELFDKVICTPPNESVRLKDLASKKYSASMLEELKQLSEIAVKRAFSECPNISSLVSALLRYPLCELHQHCLLTPGVPVAPMLAKPTKAVSDVLKRLSGLHFTMEFKYDGERAQIHLLPDGTVKIFSRNSEDLTLKYPDLLDSIW